MIKSIASAVKTTLAMIALLLAFTTTAKAQDKTLAGAKAVTNQLKEQLSLNDGQYTKVYDINKAFLVKAAENNKSALSATEKAKKLKAITDEKDAKLKSVLTEPQYKTYSANRAENNKKLRVYYQDEK
jgi:hypothetical protein